MDDFVLNEDELNIDVSGNEDLLRSMLFALDKQSDLFLPSDVLGSFDRIVSNLPSYYGYLAFQSGEGVYSLYESSQYSGSGSVVTFGDDCKVAVFDSSSGADTFLVTSAADAQIDTSQLTFMYTNLFQGFPSLGSESLDYGFLTGLVFVGCGFLAVVLRNKR